MANLSMRVAMRSLLALLLLPRCLSVRAPSASAASAASAAALLRRATELPNTYVTDAADISELRRLADAAAAEAELPAWPEAANLLCQKWRLLATTQTAGSELLQTMQKQPALGTFRVQQNWQQCDGQLRCDNVVTIGRPNDGLLSAWTLLPAGGQSSLTLQHKVTVVDDGASGQPLQFSLDLDAVTLDGNRRAGDPVETIITMPLPPQLLPGLPPPPELPVPALRDAIREAGSVNIVYLDDRLRIARSPSDVLRVFVRDDDCEALPTW